MATRSEVNALFRLLFLDLLGLPDNSIRPWGQRAPTETGLFGTVNILFMDDVSWATRVLENDPDSPDLIEHVYKDITIDLSVQFFKAGAEDTLYKLAHLLQSSRAIDKMQEVGVGLQRIGQIRDVTALVNTEYEERAQMDLTFAMNAHFITNIRAILSAKFEFNFEDGTFQSFEMELNR